MAAQLATVDDRIVARAKEVSAIRNGASFPERYRWRHAIPLRIPLTLLRH